VVVPAVPAEVELTIAASFTDGTRRRVEKLAVVTPADSASVEVVGEGRLRVLRPGRHAVVIRFLTQVVAIQVTAPQAQPPLEVDKLITNNWIDNEINAALVALRLPPSERANDATLLRRATLDLTGRLPTPQRVRDYLADESDDKFAAEVDRLLASPAFASYWTYKFARWLRIQTGPNDAAGTQAFHAWLHQQIEASRPLDEWMAELVAATGDSHEVGPANFHRSAPDARGEAEYLTESLLGIRLRCANCHNHPLDRWTQDDYHGLAAIFARLERGRDVKLKSSGEVNHPATGEAARPRIPGERFLPADGDNLPALAEWLASPDHRRLAKAQVNRLWQSLFGRGQIEPIDDLRDTNPATHPALLDRLTADFIDHRCDLRHTLRLIANSAAYQRSGRPEPASQSDDRFYSHAPERPLAAEVLLDALADATGAPTRFTDQQGEAVPGSPRAIELFTPELASRSLGPLGLACDPRRGCPTAGGGEPSTLSDLDVQLHWINGPLLNARVVDGRSELVRLAAADIPVSRLVEEYYLRTLSRRPSAGEMEFWQTKLGAGERRQKCEDFAWALMSSPEFATNH
jgi:hypothetical protein